MNFNASVNNKTGERISKIAKSLHRSRNSIISEALEDWLANHTNDSWPQKFFEFSPIDVVPISKQQEKN